MNEVDGKQEGGYDAIVFDDIHYGENGEQVAAEMIAEVVSNAGYTADWYDGRGPDGVKLRDLNSLVAEFARRIRLIPSIRLLVMDLQWHEDFDMGEKIMRELAKLNLPPKNCKVLVYTHLDQSSADAMVGGIYPMHSTRALNRHVYGLKKLPTEIAKI